MNTSEYHYSDEAFRAAVASHGSKIEAVQREVGCSRATAYRRLKKLGTRSEPEGPADSATDFSVFVPPPMPGRVKRAVDAEVEEAFTVGEPVFLVGETGSGKSTIPRQIAADLELPFLRISCDAGTEFQEMLGRLSMRDGSVFFQEGPLLKLIQVPSIAFLDEVNALDPTRMFLLHQLLDSRSVFITENGRTYQMHEAASLFLAGNPPSRSYSVEPASAAFVDRCLCILIPPFSPSEVGALLAKKHPDLPADVRSAFVRFYREMQRFGQDQSARARISIRDAERLALLYRCSGDVRSSLRNAFLNGILLTDGPEVKEACEDIAATVFGPLWKEAR